MNIKDILDNGIRDLKNNDIEEANLKCKILLARLLNVSKEYLIIHNDKVLSDDIVIKFRNQIEELKNGKPIQYITCLQEFMGLNFYVDENVLIPQPDTEILVEEALDIINKNSYKTVLDVCTGSGAIGIAITKNIKNIEVTASDISNNALEIAKKNSIANGTVIQFVLSDMFKKIDKKFDLIISNPPYIENDVISSLPKEVQNEPYIALAGGKDGLDFYKIIANNGKSFLNENGTVAVEIGYNQKQNVIQIFKNAGYKEVYSKKDYGGNDRIIVAKI